MTSHAFYMLVKKLAAVVPATMKERRDAKPTSMKTEIGLARKEIYCTSEKTICFTVEKYLAGVTKKPDSCIIV